MYWRPRPGTRAWVIAMRCSAALTWRLPERVSLTRVVLPDDTGCGAVPFHRAYALFERNRLAPAVSPMIFGSSGIEVGGPVG